MERADIFIKGLVVIIGGALSYIIGIIGVFLAGLIVLMIIDFVTGLLASRYVGRTIRSDIGKKGLIKKAYILLLVLAIYTFEAMLASQIGGSDVAIFAIVEELGLSGLTGGGIAFLFCVLELVSIAENGDKMGTSMPGPFRVIFQTASKYLNGSQEGK